MAARPEQDTDNRISITISRNQSKPFMRSVLHTHITQIYNEFDPVTRLARMRELYHPDVLASHPEEYSGEKSIIRGLENLCDSITEEQKLLAGCEIRVDSDSETGNGGGYTAVSHNLGIVHWTVFKPATETEAEVEVVKAAHVVAVEGEKIKAVWTLHLSSPTGEDSRV